MADAALAKRFSLDGRVVLITGAGGGIGRVFAWALAEAGAIVAGHDRISAAFDPLRDLLRADSLSVTEHVADLADVDARRRLFDEVVASHGRIDVLVNCAGIVARGPIEATGIETFDPVLAVDVRAPYILSQAVYPVMRAARGGSIVHLGSINSFYSLAAVSAYGLAKAALTQFTRSAAVEWALHGIRSTA